MATTSGRTRTLPVPGRQRATTRTSVALRSKTSDAATPALCCTHWPAPSTTNPPPRSSACCASRSPLSASAQQMKTLPITRDDWHGEWNYTLHPTRDTPEPD